MDFNQNGCWKMKKKEKRLQYIFIILVHVGCFLLYPYSVGASSRLNSNGSWNYDSGFYDNHNAFFQITILFIIFVLIMFYFIRRNYKLNKKNSSETSLNQEYTKMEERVREVIPSFNLEEFKNTVFEKYKEIQIAQMNFDYATLRKNCDDSLYQMYHSQLDNLRQKRQKKIMSHFRQITFRVVDIKKNNQEISLKVRTVIWCHDYIVDEEDRVVRGNKNKKSIYDYELSFIKNTQENLNYKCSNCTSKTPHDNKCDWVLSKTELISQK